MVKREATQMSTSGQQTLMSDRLRIRAVFMCVTDHHEILLNMLPNKMKTDKNTKRKELERLARKHYEGSAFSLHTAFF